MKKILLTSLLGIIACATFAEEKTRTETLKDGSRIQVDASTTTIPGVPVYVPKNIEQDTERAAQDRARYGYSINNKELPEVDTILSRIEQRSVLGLSQPVTDLNKSKIQDAQAANLGRMVKEYVRPNSRAYLYKAGGATKRVYSDTDVGKIYIQEFDSAEINTTASPNYQIGDLPAFRNTVRYADGQFVTIVLVNSGDRSSLIQVGTGKEQEQPDEAKLQRLLRSLMFESEGRSS